MVTIPSLSTSTFFFSCLSYSWHIPLPGAFLVRQAGPIPLIEQRDLSSPDDQSRSRSIYGITWSCLSTIFLCTWVAVHPNVVVRPQRRDGDWIKTWIWDPLHRFTSYKLPMFFCALLVPEYILAWAIRQYLEAGDLRKHVPGWTRTHGFFLIMGGFHLFRLPEGASSVPLPLKSSSASSKLVIPLGHHSREDEVPVCPLWIKTLPGNALELISPTEAELRDRGKSDGLTKFIVLIQTLWFVVQCVARGAQHLPLTELEVITLAYAMINFFIYIFWWDKPRNVDCPIRVYKASAEVQETKGETVKWPENWFQRFVQKVFSYLLGGQDEYVNLSEEASVPMFWAGWLDPELQNYATLGPSVLGVAFGAIHCIAWVSEFPSHSELILWRISCIAMIAVPLLSALLSAVMIVHAHGDGDGDASVWNILRVLLALLLAASVWLYVVARIATLVMAFTTLRSLPSAAFSVVAWTAFIPHI